MNLYIVIPVHNEEALLPLCLQSIVAQSITPTKVIVVNDASTDSTQDIIDQFTAKHSFIKSVYNNSEKNHQPGSKVISAFYEGFKTLDTNFNFIGKFDADIILPPDYFEKVLALFASNEKTGIAGGNLYIEDGDNWKFEAISKKTKVRGPIKLYRKECFEAIGGLKKAIGWDTVDELLAQYHGWQIKTDTSLHVKHLKPTGKAYSKNSKHKQGEAFYRMRYGFWLTFIASAKLASKKKSLAFFINSIKGYFKAKSAKLEFIVSEKEGKFIRNLRWETILRKIKHS